MFAAWLTTAAVEYLRYQFSEGSFSVSLNATNHQELCDKYKSFLGIDSQDSSVARFLARGSAQSGVFSSGHGLFCPAEAIERGASTQAEDNSSEGAIFENPEDFITVEDCADDRERRYGAESILMDKVLESMKRRLLASEEIRPELLCSMNPLIEDIRKIYRSKDCSDAPNAMMKTNVVFGLQLLVESYKTFVFSDEKTHKAVNCRVQMLKFAQDVKNTLTKVREFRPFIHDKCCPYLCNTRDLSSQIWALELDLMVLVKQKIFDLYYQAPWVAGSQMLEILSRATILGVRLCNNYQIVWAVLHLYNLLRQCGVLGEETVLLEHLCSAIGKQVFRGKPPSTRLLDSVQSLPWWKTGIRPVKKTPVPRQSRFLGQRRRAVRSPREKVARQDAHIAHRLRQRQPHDQRASDLHFRRPLLLRLLSHVRRLVLCMARIGQKQIPLRRR